MGRGFFLIKMSAVSAGGTLRSAAAFLDGDVHGGAVAAVVVAAPGIVAADGSLGGRRDVIGTDVAVGFAVAVTAAN